SFFEFFREETDLLEDTLKEELNFILSVIDTGVFMSIQLEHICVVCMPPYVAEKDEENNFHCVTGPALSFQDKENYSQYYIHGRGIPKEVFDVALNGELTRDVFMGETNEEYRAAWYEIMGPEAMLEILGADEISRGTFIHFGGVEEEVMHNMTKETFPSLENQ